MLTSKAVIALIMLFLLSPVAKLVRRLVYALVEQVDRGNPVDQATSGANAGASQAVRSIIGAGVGGAAGLAAIKSTFRKGGDSPPSGGEKPGITDAAGKAAEETGGSTGGYLVQTRGGQAESPLNGQGSSLNAKGKGDQGVDKKQIVNYKGEPISSGQGAGGSLSQEGNSSDSGITPFGMPESSSTAREGNLAASNGETASVNQSHEKSVQDGQNKSDQYKPDTIEKAGKWANVGRKTMAVAGGAVATAAGMTAGALFGGRSGSAVAHHGTKALSHVGKTAGGAAGMVAHGVPRTVQHLRTGYNQARAQGQGRMKSAGHAISHTGSQAKSSLGPSVKKQPRQGVSEEPTRSYPRSPAQTSNISEQTNTTSYTSGVNYHMDDALSKTKRSTENSSDTAAIQHYYMDKNGDESDD